ncbi:MAG: Hsp20/alpha crystallin family protein [Candidatus Promineifilaceae bacterium]
MSKTMVIKPRVDIFEKENNIVIVAEMAGVAADAVDVTLERNVLTLHGKAEAQNRIYQRAFTLSKRIDRDGISAEVKNGLLTLKLARMQEVMPETKQIPVLAG